MVHYFCGGRSSNYNDRRFYFLAGRRGLRSVSNSGIRTTIDELWPQTCQRPGSLASIEGSIANEIIVFFLFQEETISKP